MQQPNLAIRENAPLLLVFSIVVSICCVLAGYAQPFADDYCHAYDIRQADGFWAYLQHNWQNLNGRWATTSIRQLADPLLNPEAQYWLTVPISISCIFFGFWFFISSIFNKRTTTGSEPNTDTLIIVFASMMSLIFISIASKIGDLLFWSTGLTDYTFGYLLSGISIYLVVSLTKSAGPLWKDWRLYLSAFTLFINAGMSELFIIPLGLLLGYLLLSHAQRIYFLLPSMGFAIGTILNVFSPGNSARLTRVESVIDIQTLVGDSLLYGVRGLLLPVIALFLLSHVFFIRKPLLQLIDVAVSQIPQKGRQLLTIFALAYPFIVIIALVFSLGSPGPGRAHNVSMFFIILLWPVICSQLTFLKPKTFTAKFANYPLATMGFILLFSVNIKKLSEDVSGDAQAYSASLNKARSIMSSKDNVGQDVVLSNTAKRPNSASGSGFIVTTDKNNWVNQCLALYHLNKSTQWAR